jgi:hypothetical protein
MPSSNLDAFVESSLPALAFITKMDPVEKGYAFRYLVEITKAMEEKLERPWDGWNEQLGSIAGRLLADMQNTEEVAGEVMRTFRDEVGGQLVGEEQADVVDLVDLDEDDEEEDVAEIDVLPLTPQEDRQGFYGDSRKIFQCFIAFPFF